MASKHLSHNYFVHRTRSQAPSPVSRVIRQADEVRSGWGLRSAILTGPGSTDAWTPCVLRQVRSINPTYSYPSPTSRLQWLNDTTEELRWYHSGRSTPHSLPKLTHATLYKPPLPLRDNFASHLRRHERQRGLTTGTRKKQRQEGIPSLG